jgi:hypothetical protein
MGLRFITLLERFHADLKGNRWMYYFTIFNRVVLAAGFLPAGYVKIIGERFTDLHNNQPMGHYLEALHQTGYYYTLIGIFQMMAAIFLLIPRTALLGALIYFPIILNICLLSFALRFEGSLLTAPLMVISNIYLLCWDYEKLKLILPFKETRILKNRVISNQFPFSFFFIVFLIVIGVGFIVVNLYEVKPRNTLSDCQEQFNDTTNQKAAITFCNCIHIKGNSLSRCLDQYYQTVKK